MHVRRHQRDDHTALQLAELAADEVSQLGELRDVALVPGCQLTSGVRGVAQRLLRLQRPHHLRDGRDDLAGV